MFGCFSFVSSHSPSGISASGEFFASGKNIVCNELKRYLFHNHYLQNGAEQGRASLCSFEAKIA